MAAVAVVPSSRHIPTSQTHAELNSCAGQVVVDVMEPGKLVLYPQILLACIALLGISYVHLWSLLLQLLSKVRCPQLLLCEACILYLNMLSWLQHSNLTYSDILASICYESDHHYVIEATVEVTAM